MSVYLFRGRQLPGMVDTADMHWQSLVRSENGDTEYSVDIRHQGYEFEAKVDVLKNAAALDVPTLRNTVEKIVRSHIDALGFLEGFGADVGIYEVVLPDGQVEELHPVIPRLIKLKQDFHFAGKHLDFLKLVDDSHQLQEALNSFRLAIREHGHTGAFCFRAIEAVKEHFRTVDDFEEGRPLKQSIWNKFNTALRLSPTWTQEIPEFARPQRHGTPKANLDEERAEMFRRTAEVINRFSIFLAGGGVQPLSVSQYPLLECQSSPCLDLEEHEKLSQSKPFHP